MPDADRKEAGLKIMSMKKIYSLFVVLYCYSFTLWADSGPGRPSQRGLPVKAFRENAGQITDQYGKARADIDWHLENDGVMIYLGGAQMSYQWCRLPDKPLASTPLLSPSFSHGQGEIFEIYRMDVVLLGANPDAICLKEMPLKTYENYYRAEKGVMRVHYFQKVTYKEVYPGIDWVLFLEDKQLKYEFVVHPGGRVEDIKLQYRGTKDLQLLDGNLVAATPMGRVVEQRPYTYQAEGREEIASSYVLTGNVLSFDVASYSGTLVIDPFINVEWSTYYGGIGTESAIVQYTQFSGTSYFNPSVVVDGENNTVLYGTTSSRENIATTGSHLAMVQSVQNAFLVKMNGKGARIWATYYGDGNPSNYGTVSGSGHSVAADGQGNIYITGSTNSTTGIATKGSFREELDGWQDLFLAKFDKNGNRLWGTYYGTGSAEYHGSVAVNPSGSTVYLAGSTEGPSDELATTGAFFPFSGGSSRRAGFLVRFDGNGNRQWSTFIQPTDRGYTDVMDLCLDNKGNVFVGGTSFGDIGAFFLGDLSIASYGAHQSLNSTPGPYGRDAFLQKWDADGKRLWGTFYGGDRQDYGNGIASDEQGNAYMTGGTMSPTAIATPGSWQENFDGNTSAYTTNAFIVQFNAGGQRRWGTYLGGESTTGADLACGNGNVFVTGGVYGENLAADSCAYQNKSAGRHDAFIAAFSREGKKQEISFFGGAADDVGFSLATASEEGRPVLYLAGSTSSQGGIAFSERYPVYKENLIGNNADYFLTRFSYFATKQELASCFAADSLLIRPRYAGRGPYHWSNGSRMDSLWVKTSGQYIVSYQFRTGCPQQDTIDVHLYPLPQLHYTDSACVAGQGASGFAAAAVTGYNHNNYRYEWYDSEGEVLRERESTAGDSIAGLPPGAYTLHIRTPLCDTSLAFIIQAYPEVELLIAADTTIAAGQVVPLWVKGKEVDSVYWTPAHWLDTFYSFHPLASPQAPVTYIATGTNIYGCFNTASVRIDIMEDLFIPNAFSPNGDGVNDVFRVENGGYRRMLDFSIFNRWGQRVFSGAHTIDGGWDGTYNGQIADGGVYHYYIKTELRDKVEVFKGDLTLLR